MKNAAHPGKGGAALEKGHQVRSDLGVSQSSDAAQALPIEISKFWKSRQRNEIVRVEISEFKGHVLINVRVWATGTDGIDRPTPKGLALGISKLPELADAIDKAYFKARELGLIARSS
jgi:hypothetical protein